MFVATSFTNEFGQVIEPGDPVLFVGTCSHQSYVDKGIFEGINQDKYSEITSVRVSRENWRRQKISTAFPLKRVYKLI